jgi:hypothetical protein
MAQNTAHGAAGAGPPVLGIALARPRQALVVFGCLQKAIRCVSFTRVQKRQTKKTAYSKKGQPQKKLPKKTAL